jgi:sortase A
MARAEPVAQRPSVTIDRQEAAPGEHVVLTITGFTATSVTVSICGNEDRRGSTDCNMAASQSVDMHTDGTPSTAEIPVATPPVGCPCLIRVSSRLNDEVAVVPFTLLGHPIAPVIEPPNPDTPLVAVSVEARAIPRGLVGWARSNLGGSVPYEVTVTVKNLTTETLHHVMLFGSVGRSAEDEIATLDLDNPGELAPGQTWTQVVSAEVPAPSLSSVQWQVVASRAGPWVIATATTRHRPALLLILAMVLVVSFSVLAIRYRMRRRALREMSAGQELVVLLPG